MSVTLAFGAGDGLMHTKQQRHVAVDAFLLQDLGGADAFPGGGELDEDALAGDAGLIVEGDDLAGLGDGLFPCRSWGGRRPRWRRGRG